MSRLRIDDKPGEDTRANVRAVLRFMADAFLAMEEAGQHGFDQCEKSREGAYLILSECEEALREPEESEAEHE